MPGSPFVILNLKLADHAASHLAQFIPGPLEHFNRCGITPTSRFKNQPNHRTVKIITPNIDTLDEVIKGICAGILKESLGQGRLGAVPGYQCGLPRKPHCSH